MQPLTRQDLMSLEEYAQRRPEFRARVLAHKKNRQVAIGPNATLSFEDRETIQYQVQEMLRIERIFEPDGIDEELSAYNPLIPDGGNLKATFMLEFTDVAERRAALAQLRGIENRVWLRVGQGERIRAVFQENGGVGAALARLRGIEERVWLRVGEGERIPAVADEDLERANEEKTSAVHFLRFELDDSSRRALKSGAAIALGIDHPSYDYATDPVPEPVRAALAADIE